jgi:hypothetical protein
MDKQEIKVKNLVGMGFEDKKCRVKTILIYNHRMLY